VADENLSEKIARSTLQVVVGNSVGSGFLFGDARTVVTNYHVVSGASAASGGIRVRNYVNGVTDATLTLRSADRDYAVLSLSAPQPSNVPPLTGDIITYFQRGTQVIFAGYPFGLDPLLVTPAWISGPLGDDGFVVSGSINLGNSGGPVVDVATGNVIGIASAKRFLGSLSLQELKKQQDDLVKSLTTSSQRFSNVMGGIDFNQLSIVVAKSLQMTQDLLLQNANPSIGIVYSIKHVMLAIAAK
jgi:hypothetical protein